jgi:hypothetical protein
MIGQHSVADITSESRQLVLMSAWRGGGFVPLGNSLK